MNRLSLQVTLEKETNEISCITSYKKSRFNLSAGITCVDICEVLVKYSFQVLLKNTSINNIDNVHDSLFSLLRFIFIKILPS